MGRSRRTCLSSKWLALLSAMKWVTGLEFQTFLLCSQARMRLGTRGGLKDSIFPVPLPAMIQLPTITTAHPTFWYISLKVPFLPTHVLLFNFCFLPSLMFAHFPLLCCCFFWNNKTKLLDISEKFSPPLRLHFFYYFLLKSHLGNQFCNVYIASNGQPQIRRFTATGKDSNQAVLCVFMMLYFFHCCHS